MRKIIRNIVSFLLIICSIIISIYSVVAIMDYSAFITIVLFISSFGMGWFLRGAVENDHSHKNQSLK